MLAAEKGFVEARANEKKFIDELNAKRKDLEVKNREIDNLQRIADDLKKVNLHITKVSEEKELETKKTKEDIKSSLQHDHAHAQELLKAEHKREMDRLKTSYEESIVDLTVQNCGNQQQGNDILKQKILLLKEEIKTLKGELEKSKSRKEVRFEAESPTKGNPTNKRKATKSHTPNGETARKKSKPDEVIDELL